MNPHPWWRRIFSSTAHRASRAAQGGARQFQGFLSAPWRRLETCRNCLTKASGILIDFSRHAISLVGTARPSQIACPEGRCRCSAISQLIGLDHGTRCQVESRRAAIAISTELLSAGTLSICATCDLGSRCQIIGSDHCHDLVSLPEPRPCWTRKRERGPKDSAVQSSTFPSAGFTRAAAVDASFYV